MLGTVHKIQERVGRSDAHLLQNGTSPERIRPVRFTKCKSEWAERLSGFSVLRSGWVDRRNDRFE